MKQSHMVPSYVIMYILTTGPLSQLLHEVTCAQGMNLNCEEDENALYEYSSLA